MMNNHLFEVSWEVCNKVGGINTVLVSKAPYVQKHYKNNYCLIGPYFPENTVAEFQERIPPEKLHAIFDKLHSEGIVCHYGSWLINNNPHAILIDYSGYTYMNNEVKRRLWESFGIDSLSTAFHDFDEPVLWGYAVGRLLEEISKAYKQDKIIAHFHEWLSCGALLYLKMRAASVSTVFTTHATMLGRTLSGKDIDIYSILDSIDAEAEAYKCEIAPKHQVERTAAKLADVFTTVSEITGIEAEHFLGKKPDLLLFNGIDIKNHPSLNELAIKHRLYKDKIKGFLQYYFFPYYSFDLDNTLIYFLSGRYEFHNKGIDVLLKALGKLNTVLKKEKSRKTIVVFFWVPAGVIRIKPSLSKSRAYYYDVWDSIDDDISTIKKRLTMCFLSQKTIKETSLFSNEFLKSTKKKVRRFLSEGNPPLSTHDLINEPYDPILNGFKANELLNHKDDKVKVVFYPTYLNGADTLLDLSYDEAVMGSHLGVFPSYYEPWGYTPVETAALGVSSITTDFAGFGRYLKLDASREDKGIFISEMFGKSEKEKIDNLYSALYSFCKLNTPERVSNKVIANDLVLKVSWDTLIHNYLSAYKLALERAPR